MIELSIESSDGLAPVRRKLATPYAVIGRDANADVVLDHDQVSKRHALLQEIDGRLFCVDLGSRTGVRWDSSAAPSGWLVPGQKIAIGPYMIGVGDDALVGIADNANDLPTNPLARDSSGTGPHPGVSMESLGGTTGPSRIPIRRTMTLVGRSRRCKLRLAHPSVSKVHCSLLNTPEGLWVTDLLGRGGIRIDGTAVRHARLVGGEILGIGQFEFRVLDPTSVPSSVAAAGVHRPARVTHPPARIVPAAITDRPAPHPHGVPRPSPPTDPAWTMPNIQFNQYDYIINTIEEFVRANMLFLQGEIDRIGRLARQLEALRVEGRHCRPGAGARTGVADLGRLVELLLQDTVDGPADVSPRPACATALAGALPNTSAGVPDPECHDVPPVVGHAGNRPGRLHRAERPPRGQGDDGIHDLIHRRIDEMQSERRGRWQKILDLVVGH